MVSTTRRFVALGGGVSVALLIDAVYKGFGFLRGSGVYVTQQAVQ